MALSIPSAEVAGYPVVRALGHTGSAVVFLTRYEGKPRVLRLFDTCCPAEQSDQEIEARDRAPLAHAAGLLDLATSDEGAPVAVLEHIAGPRLDELLHDRAGNLAAGEAVTLIVPLVEAILSAHDLGLTYGGLTADGIRLRASGAPVITRFRHARAGPVLPPHLRERERDYRLDHDAARALAARIASAVPAAHGSSLREVLDRHHEDLASAIPALFDCVAPTPVRTVRAETTETAGEHHREVGAVLRADPGVVRGNGAALPVRGEREPGRLEVLLTRLAVPEAIICAVAEGIARARLVARAMHGRLAARVRLRYLAIGSAGVLALLAAALVLGAGDSQGEEVSVGEPGAAVEAEFDGEPTTSEGGSEHPDHTDESLSVDESLSAPDSASDAPDRLLQPGPEEWNQIVDALVARWLACRAKSERSECASSVVQAGSSAEVALHERDERWTLALESWTAGAAELVVVERMGAAVLIDLIAEETTMASLLVMRSEAGWRLRDVLI